MIQYRVLAHKMSAMKVRAVMELNGNRDYHEDFLFLPPDIVEKEEALRFINNCQLEDVGEEECVYISDPEVSMFNLGITENVFMREAYEDSHAESDSCYIYPYEYHKVKVLTKGAPSGSRERSFYVPRYISNAQTLYFINHSQLEGYCEQAITIVEKEEGSKPLVITKEYFLFNCFEIANL